MGRKRFAFRAQMVQRTFAYVRPQQQAYSGLFLQLPEAARVDEVTARLLSRQPDVPTPITTFALSRRTVSFSTPNGNTSCRSRVSFSRNVYWRSIVHPSLFPYTLLHSTPARSNPSLDSLHPSVHSSLSHHTLPIPTIATILIHLAETPRDMVCVVHSIREAEQTLEATLRLALRRRIALRL